MHTTPRTFTVARSGLRRWLGFLALAVTLATTHAQTTIEILEQPRDVTTLYYREATFTIVARAFTNGNVPAPLTYQWIEQVSRPFTDWIEIPGATNATLVRPPSPGCTNTFIYCEVRSGEARLTSSPARLRRFADCPRLNIVSVEANVADQEVVVTFDRVLDRSSAEESLNYRLKERDQTNQYDGIFPSSVQMQNSKTVSLRFREGIGLRDGAHYALHPSVDYLRDCCGDWSCGCGVLPDYPFGWPFSTTTTIEILQQPANVISPFYLAATFSVVARAFTDNTNAAPVTYQWQVWDWAAFAWNDIPGATTATWVRPPSDACISAEYRCLVRSGDSFLASDRAQLHLYTECLLRISSVEASVAAQEIVVGFNTPLDPIQAQDIFNYRLNEHDRTNEIDGIYPIEITMRDSATVVLHFDPAQGLRSETRYVLFPSEYIVDCCNPPSCGCSLDYSQIAFGLPFVTRSESCAQIIQQPGSTPTSLGCRATFEVQAEWLDSLEHLPLRYQWFRNGIRIHEATQRTYATDPVFPGHTNDSYFVEIYGACETLRSTSVSPVVRTNVETLRLHSIRPGQARHSVIVSFAPACDGAIVALQEGASALDNFQWSGGLITQTARRDCTGTNIILITSSPQPGSNYSLTISNIRDQGGHELESGTVTGNFIAPAPPPLPATGHLQLTTAGQLFVLEWAGGGTLQTTFRLDGSWQDLPLAVSPLVLESFGRCGGSSLTFGSYYRVRWPAAH